MDILLPSLAGLARMTTIHAQRTDSNVGAQAVAVIYTTPAGRLAIITLAGIMWSGGTTPTRLILWVRNAAGVVVNDIVQRNTIVQLDMEWAVQPFVIPETYDLQYRITGGDGTTDIGATATGVEFDWFDVT